LGFDWLWPRDGERRRPSDPWASRSLLAFYPVLPVPPYGAAAYAAIGSWAGLPSRSPATGARHHQGGRGSCVAEHGWGVRRGAGRAMM